MRTYICTFITGVSVWLYCCPFYRFTSTWSSLSSVYIFRSPSHLIMLSLPRIPSSTTVKDIICLLILLVSGQVSILQPLLSHTCVCRARCIVFLKSIFISFFTQTVFLSYHLLMLGVRYILYQQCLCTNCSEKPVHSLAVVLVRLGRDSNHLRKSFFF